MTGVAQIHSTTLTPGKLEVIQSWLPYQGWFDGDAAGLRIVGSYRLVDPDDVVGIETHLLTSGDGVVWHIPLTYRSEPLDGGELVGTLEHGVLGERHVYHGPSDPVYAERARAAIVQRHSQADLSTGDPASAQAVGSGLDGDDDALDLVVSHRSDRPVQGAATLQVTWNDDDGQHQVDLAALTAAG